VTVFGFIVFLLCALTSAFCAGLLLRAFWRRHDRLLFWSFLYFLFLALNSFEVFLDYITPSWFDLTIIRAFTSLVAVCIMLYGFIWELA
jgi:hypothetical protein